MYEKSAAMYDLLFAARGKSYEAESLYVAQAIRQRTPDARTLLDVACGTGGHLEWLRHEFEVEGVELSSAMLARARERLPDAPLHQGDMRTFDLSRRYDAVVCLFSAIGYMTSEDDLRVAIATMAAHLVPGGVLVVEPWVHPDVWKVGFVTAHAAQEPARAVALATRSTQEGDVSVFTETYVVATPDGVDIFTEEHRLGLYDEVTYEAAFRAAGLEVDHDPVGPIGRGLFVGTRRL